MIPVPQNTRRASTVRRRAQLAAATLVLSPLVGMMTILISVRLSGESWESPEPGSSANLLALVLPPLWGGVLYLAARRIVTTVAVRVAIAIAAIVWSLGFWWIVVALSG